MSNEMNDMSMPPVMHARPLPMPNAVAAASQELIIACHSWKPVEVVDESTNYVHGSDYDYLCDQALYGSSPYDNAWIFLALALVLGVVIAPFVWKLCAIARWLAGSLLSLIWRVISA